VGIVGIGSAYDLQHETATQVDQIGQADFSFPSTASVDPIRQVAQLPFLTSGGVEVCVLLAGIRTAHSVT
jgi:hypothetical protein